MYYLLVKPGRILQIFLINDLIQKIHSAYSVSFTRGQYFIQPIPVKSNEIQIYGCQHKSFHKFRENYKTIPQKNNWLYYECGIDDKILFPGIENMGVDDKLGYRAIIFNPTKVKKYDTIYQLVTHGEQSWFNKDKKLVNFLKLVIHDNDSRFTNLSCPISVVDITRKFCPYLGDRIVCSNPYSTANMINFDEIQTNNSICLKEKDFYKKINIIQANENFLSNFSNPNIQLSLKSQKLPNKINNNNLSIQANNQNNSYANYTIYGIIAGSLIAAFAIVLGLVTKLSYSRKNKSKKLQADSKYHHITNSSFELTSYDSEYNNTTQLLPEPEPNCIEYSNTTEVLSKPNHTIEHSNTTKLVTQSLVNN